MKKFYVYCVVEGIEELPHSLHGVDGRPVRLLKRDEFSLLVSDYAAERVPVTRENVMAHAAVMQNVLKRTTPLPFRFGTIITEEQLDKFLTARRDALYSKLEIVRGCVEMNVKIIRDANSTELLVTSGSGKEKPGTAFLVEKRREILAGEARAAEAKRVAEWLEGHVAELVKEVKADTDPTSKFKPNSTSKLLVAAAHLVERNVIEEFRKNVAEARRQRPELHFLVSGPWAPYSFANLDLEFKTHFGVS